VTSDGDPILPQSIDLERDVLNQALEYGRVAPGLTCDDFFRQVHRQIWAVIQDLAGRGLSTEHPIARQALQERGQLDVVGAVYLHELSRNGVILRDAALASAADQLRTLKRRRRLAELVIRYAEKPGDVDLDQLDRDIQALRIAAGVGQKSSFRSARELAEAAERVDWIVRGFLARGAITELTGKAKLSGKTTLIAHIVACVLDGDHCLGSMAAQSPVVYLTEQTHSTFRENLRRAGLLQREDLSILSFWDVKGQPWPAIMQLAEAEAVRIGAKFIVVDTLAQFAGITGDGENNSGDALTALAPLQQAAHHGHAILISRHARKSGGDVGEDGRGSSAFTGGVDIVLSLKRPEGNHKPTMRLLEGLSRFDETPSRIVIDKVSVHVPDPEVDVWTDGFVVLGDTDAVAHDEAKDALRQHLPVTEDEALTMKDLQAVTGVNRATLSRALKTYPGLRIVGKGGKRDPLRYFRPEVDCVQTSNPKGTREHNPFLAKAS
jgi:RecA-family ATPase